MSYILEALKKSDLQRQRGTTPTLQLAQVEVAAPKRPSVLYYGLVALVLLAGIMIGLLRPWQAEQLPAEHEPLAQVKPIVIPQQTAPMPMPAVIPVKTVQALPSQDATPEVLPDAVEPVQQQSEGLNEVVEAQQAMPFNELPVAIQQEIPKMAVQMHAYSSKPGESLVSINSIRLRDGGTLIAGLKLEQITPDGMIFSYKGYRFWRGIR